MERFRKLLMYMSFVIILLISINNVSSQELAKKTDIDVDVSARIRFVFPRLFDFEHFKEVFNKFYGSLIENLARRRLFLGRTFEAFISAVSYKHFKVNFYLGINQMSDWTLDEQKAILMDNHFFDDNEALFGMEDGNESEDELPVADLKEIEKEFEEIEEHKGKEPGYKEIAQELENIQRFKRDAEEEVRENFSVRDLIKKFERLSSMRVKTKTNEPKIEDQEISRESSSEEMESSLQEKKVIGREQEHLTADEVEVISKQPGEHFLKTVVSVATSMFSKSKTQREKTRDVVYHDYRKSNCYLPPKDQKGCSICYAFAALGMYEWSYCSATGIPLAFSEQYPIDCGSDVGINGCNFGKYDMLSNFTTVYGLNSLDNYPYIGKGGKCPFDKRETSAEEMAYLRFIDEGWVHVPIKKFEEQLKKSPIVINMLVTDKIHQYGGGVDDGLHCDENYRHSALLIGSGREDGLEYWLFRFAFTEAYGEGGHYKLNKKSKCLARFGSVLKAKFGKTPDENLNPNYLSKPVEELKEDYLQKDASRQT